MNNRIGEVSNTMRVRLTTAATWRRLVRFHRDQRGLNTAELLGNAALAILALIVIWGALQAAGVNIVGWIEQQLLGGGGGTVGS